jgi:formylglycine-generating enzyme required for sulfatase activity
MQNHTGLFGLAQVGLADVSAISPSAFEAVFGPSQDSTFESQHHVYQDPKVDLIAGQLLPYVPRQGIHVLVISDRSANGMTLMGGHIYITSGMLSVLANDDDALAFVIAHEMAHANRYHDGQAYAAQFVSKSLINKLINCNQPVLRGITLQLVQARSTRSQEEEADRDGVGYACAAGLDPEGAARFFATFHGASAHASWFDDHPSPVDRTKRLHDPIQKCLDARIAASKLSTITFNNQSEQNVAVKLVGPSGRTVEIASAQSATLRVEQGEYIVLVRYGSDEATYAYGKGGPIKVIQTETQHSAVTVALHGAAPGSNSELAPEFDAAKPPVASSGATGVQATASPIPGMGPAPGGARVNPRDGLMYVWIPPGTFMMGCSPGDNKCDADEKPSHQVKITKGFWMGQTEVTAGAFKRFAAANGLHIRHSPAFNIDWANDIMPMVIASWDNAHDYCTWAGGRLPTEAEWEYAARAGSLEARYGSLDEIGWYSANSKQQTQEVAQKRANGFGLYDVLGNASEWVNDWYDQKYYQNSPSQDPPGPASGQMRVLRGGSWEHPPWFVRVSDRNKHDPALTYDSYGFRCGGDVFAH